MNRIIDFIAVAIFLIGGGYGIYSVGHVDGKASKPPVSNFIYYDYDRVHIDSKYSTTVMYDHTGEKIGYYIKFTHKGDVIIVDCIDDHKGTAEENRDSYLYPFKIKEIK